MRIHSANEAHLQYKQGTSSSFEKDWHYSKTFLNESLLSLGVSIKNIYSLWKAAKTNQLKMLKKILVPKSCYIEI